MRKTGDLQWRRIILPGVFTAVLVLALGLFIEAFSIVSFAESQGKVTASAASIRKEPSTSSEKLGSVVKDKVITINNQVKGSDGYIWYQVFVDSETLGYIRSDLVEITDGSTPTTVTPVTPTTPDEPSADVLAVNPVSATVSGSSSVNVRSSASTQGDVVTKVSRGHTLTVTGTVNGSDGKLWYQVNFILDGEEVNGFIRSDYATLSGELTPYTEEPPEEDPPVDPGEPEQEPGPETVKDYDTMLIDGEWYLTDNVKQEQYNIQKDLFDKVNANFNAYQDEVKKNKSQKVIIIILVMLLMVAAAAVVLLIFKIKDMKDEAYFSRVESETLRRREASRQGSPQKVMHTVGAEGARQGRTGASSGQGSSGTKTSPARPSGTQPGARPAGARPSGTSAGQGSSGARPAGARPAANSGGNPSGARPAGARPAANSGGNPSGARPAGARPGAANSGGNPSGARPAGARPAGANASGQRQTENRQSRNFMAENDDEFEFEFLNYDGDEEHKK